jgi:nitrate/TMAO reductase-like tetraheme cytochrome c subunit
MRLDQIVRQFLSSLLLGLSAAAWAEEIPHLKVTQPGGFPGRPVLNSIQAVTNGVTVTWDGPAGYYQLYLAAEIGGVFKATGAPNPNRTLTLTNLPPHGFFKVSGPSAQYAGAESCAECHLDIYHLELRTPHAQALQTLSPTQQTNPACLPCHTVGFGFPTGFRSVAATPQLGAVQCENCHGPGAVHAASAGNLARRNRSELAAEVCGGCHTGTHQPTFEEWQISGHAKVTEDMNPADRISACGRCHSGSARLALIRGENPQMTVTNDANVAITCVVCHDPHQTHVWTNVLSAAVTTNQLRYATASTNDFFLTTRDNFTNKYNVNINVCAQCHNHRGAAWTNTSRPPHHSPQYNLLLGTVGELPAGMTPIRATHATALEKQCVSCHRPTRDYQDEAHPALTGHSFREIAYNACLSCHPYPEDLVFYTGLVISARIDEIKDLLDLWATTRAHNALRSKYQELAWEYTDPGDLSAGDDGPDETEQELIPDNIKKARFNLYLVAYDGSLATHNPYHTLDLLDAAYSWVVAELSP